MPDKATSVVDAMTSEEKEQFGKRRSAGVDDIETDIAEEWPTLDCHALHGVAGEIVKAIGPHSEADPVAILAQLLCAFGNAAGRSAYYQVEADRHYPNLYAVLVGPSAKGRKGTSLGHVMKLLERIDEAWEANRRVSGLSSGEGMIWAVRNPIEKREPIKEKNRVTGYQIVITDEGVDDKRLFIVETEFASALRVVGRDGNTLSAVVRNAWDSGKLGSLTKNSPARATDAHISIIGHITEDELRRYLDSTEAANGFGNRFLWFCVRRSKCLPEGGQVDQLDFSDILRRLQLAIDFARTAGRITWESAARSTWHRVYSDLSQGESGLFGQITSRAEAQVVRLALIYALLDCSPHINQEHLTAALAIWEFVEQSARFIFGDSLGDPVADEILKAVRRNPLGLTRTDISGLFNRNRTAGQIGAALGLLVREGKIRCERVDIEGKGRPAEIWFPIGAKTI